MVKNMRNISKLDLPFYGPFRIQKINNGNAEVVPVDRPFSNKEIVPLDRLCLVPKEVPEIPSVIPKSRKVKREVVKKGCKIADDLPSDAAKSLNPKVCNVVRFDMRKRDFQGVKLSTFGYEKVTKSNVKKGLVNMDQKKKYNQVAAML